MNESHTSDRAPKIVRFAEDFKREQKALSKQVNKWFRLGKHTNDENLQKMNHFIDKWIRNMEKNILS